MSTRKTKTQIQHTGALPSPICRSQCPRPLHQSHRYHTYSTPVCFSHLPSGEHRHSHSRVGVRGLHCGGNGAVLHVRDDVSGEHSLLRRVRLCLFVFVFLLRACLRVFSVALGQHTLNGLNNGFPTPSAPAGHVFASFAFGKVIFIRRIGVIHRVIVARYVFQELGSGSELCCRLRRD